MSKRLLEQEFPQDPDICYLNHAAVAPWPKRTADAVQAFARENLQRGATDYPVWLQTENALRAKLAQMIEAPSTRNIALQKSTSEGLSAIAYGLDWQPGDRIVITDQEFPSNRIVWESLGSKGVEVIESSLIGEDPEHNIIAALDDSVRLLSVSSVQYASGLVLDLERLGQACRERDILFCVDAIQSIGALPFSVTGCQADFVVADGHKWMLGPEGLALFYVSDRALDQLTLNQFGWHMVQDRGNYDRKTWEIAEDAKRFECGSPNMLGAYALNASLGLLLEYGLDQVHQELLAKVQLLQEALQQRSDLELLTDLERPLRSGIITFRHRGIAPESLFAQLRDQGVVCACRGGGVRFSPHFYTPDSVLAKAVERIPQ
ncbi:MAG: aminotransferase class V-fold PLP-dependent enzyme [Pseudomonadota bacterium]|nr:aminotransferase class V-fold PLP-dependent enzyme [Pseudomonadota bacterium]